jgi:hypothetical protein
VPLLASERDELLLVRETRDHVSPGDGTHRDVDDNRTGNPDRQRVRARDLRPTGRPQPRRRGRRQDPDEPGVGEPPHIVAEHPRGKRPLADDDPSMRGRVRDLPADDVREHEIPDRAIAVPALKAAVVDHQLGLRVRVVSVKRLEPRDARVPVSELAARLRFVEVLPEQCGVRSIETEVLQAPDAFVTLHDVRTPAPASCALSQSGEAYGPG